ncbi:MAG: acetyl-CoA carboxylase carboxyl transferase subunit beta, partial [Oscillospiraceae bacterium]|nr:acetyl-CoA carboxylase carboxyl transferase subunit beta [Oscillospiraceae bacterium]
MNLYGKRKEWLNIFKDVRKKLLISNMKAVTKSDSNQTCSKCEKIFVKADIIKNSFQCPNCGNNLKIRATERIQMIMDTGSFKETCAKLKTANPLNFPGYEEKIKYLTESLNMHEAVITGEGTIDNNRCVICAMDNHFLMGSMGSVVGDKITKSIEYATKKALPIIIICTSGGARMQEGIISLMQMTKTSAALS